MLRFNDLPEYHHKGWAVTMSSLWETTEEKALQALKEFNGKVKVYGDKGQYSTDVDQEEKRKQAYLFADRFGMNESMKQILEPNEKGV